MPVMVPEGRVEELSRPSVPTVSVFAVGVVALTVAFPILTARWGLSYPGFPMTAAFLLFLDVIALAVLATRWWIARRDWGMRWSRSWWMLAVGAGLAALGFFGATHLGDAPLHARWAASSAAFEAEVATLATAVGAAPAGEPASVTIDRLCPTGIGEFAISDCRTLHDGYLFLQAPDALTDDSGIVYFPAGVPTDPDGWSQENLTPLGGPWWAWTCNC